MDETYFRVGPHILAVTDVRGFMLMAKTEFIVNRIRANIPGKEGTKLGNM